MVDGDPEEGPEQATRIRSQPGVYRQLLSRPTGRVSYQELVRFIKIRGTIPEQSTAALKWTEG